MEKKRCIISCSHSFEPGLKAFPSSSFLFRIYPPSRLNYFSVLPESSSSPFPCRALDGSGELPIKDIQKS
jgi:hypothetical protein